METGQAKLLSASGAISSQGCRLLGFYVASTTSGTIILKDGGTSGTAVTGTITPAVGWHFLPVDFPTSAYAAISNTISVTFVFVPV